MKKIVIILTLLFFTSNLSAQVIEILDDMHFYQVMNSDKVIVSEYDKIEGTPYFNKDYIDCIVYFRNDSVYKIALRYNIFDNRMEYKYKDLVYSIANPRDIYKIEMGDKTFIYYYSKENLNFEGYYQLLVNGKALLLVKMKVSYREKEKPKGIEESKPERFVRGQNKYYVVISGQEPKWLKNKKSIPEIFGEQSDKMLAYVKKQKISFKNEKDLIRLVEYYNSIQ